MLREPFVAAHGSGALATAGEVVEGRGPVVGVAHQPILPDSLDASE
jgi:hypothetical protein